MTTGDNRRIVLVSTRMFAAVVVLVGAAGLTLGALSLAGSNDNDAASEVVLPPRSTSGPTTTTTAAASTTTGGSPSTTAAATTSTTAATTSTSPASTSTTEPPSERNPLGGDDPEDGLMPDLICFDLQAAQDEIQDHGVFFSRSEDASGNGRRQLWDRNWVVIDQDPAPGTPIGERDAVLYVLKDDEPHDC